MITPFRLGRSIKIVSFNDPSVKASESFNFVLILRFKRHYKTNFIGIYSPMVLLYQKIIFSGTFGIKTPIRTYTNVTGCPCQPDMLAESYVQFPLRKGAIISVFTGHNSAESLKRALKVPRANMAIRSIRQKQFL